MCKAHTEYRINKKGAEFYRTTIAEDAHKKLQELQAKRPGVYTLQSRCCYLDLHGMELTDLTGKAIWSAWH